MRPTALVMPSGGVSSLADLLEVAWRLGELDEVARLLPFVGWVDWISSWEPAPMDPTPRRFVGLYTTDSRTVAARLHEWRRQQPC